MFDYSLHWKGGLFLGFSTLGSQPHASSMQVLRNIAGQVLFLPEPQLAHLGNGDIAVCPTDLQWAL